MHAEQVVKFSVLLHGQESLTSTAPEPVYVGLGHVCPVLMWLPKGKERRHQHTVLTKLAKLAMKGRVGAAGERIRESGGKAS